jgi:hypothetical protein
MASYKLKVDLTFGEKGIVRGARTRLKKLVGDVGAVL